jgi:hypothetical protein
MDTPDYCSVMLIFLKPIAKTRLSGDPLKSAGALASGKLRAKIIVPVEVSSAVARKVIGSG